VARDQREGGGGKETAMRIHGGDGVGGAGEIINLSHGHPPEQLQIIKD
jgi:hypothetical protein